MTDYIIEQEEKRRKTEEKPAAVASEASGMKVDSDAAAVKTDSESKPPVGDADAEMETDEPGVHAEDAQMTDAQMILEFRSEIEEAETGLSSLFLLLDDIVCHLVCDLFKPLRSYLCLL